MAETLFIADESDARNSVANVIAILPVRFVQQRRWETPHVTGSSDLVGYPKLCVTGLTFFVLPSSESIKMKEVKGTQAQTFWEFDYRGTTGWIMLEAGGLWEKSGDKRWVPGRIRANLSNEAERELYSAFKKLWLKGYKTDGKNIKFGPSATQTLANEVIANW